MTSASEMREHIQQLIFNTEDLAILQQVIEYIKTLNLPKEKDWWEELSHTQKELILKGQQELEQGKEIPFSQVQEKALKILNR